MSELTNKLHDQRLRAANALLEYADTPEDKWTGEVEEAYRNSNKEYDRLDGLLRDEQKREEREAEWTAAAALAAAKQGSQEPAAREADWLENCRKAISEERVEKAGQYESAPDPREFRPTTRSGLAHRLESRTTLAVGTSGSGPEVVDQTLVDQLFEKYFDDSGIMQAGPTVLRTDTGEPIKFPRLAALNPLSQANVRRAESASIQFAEPTLDQVTLNAFKYAQASKMSREIIEDAVIDVRGLVGKVQGRNLANGLGTDLLTGTGTGMPRGIVQVVTDSTGTTLTGATGQTGGLAGTVGGDTDEFSKLISIVFKIKPGYRRGAKWLVSDSTILALRKIKVSTAGSTVGVNYFAWDPGSADTPATLLGYPVVMDPFMPSMALNAYSIIFGDFSHYYVRFVNNVRVEWSTEFAWQTDEIAVKSVVRADGDAIDDAAFSSFKGAAS